MNIVRSSQRNKHYKVHSARDGRPLCGGGPNGKSITTWQEDLAAANCERCHRILNPLPKKPKTTTTHDQA